MQLSFEVLPELAHRLIVERKQQGLSRTQAASVCNVSASFIRDAESDPARCSLGKLLRLTQGLGLSLTATGWQVENAANPAHAATAAEQSDPPHPDAP